MSHIITHQLLWFWIIFLIGFAACHAQEKQYTDQSGKSVSTETESLRDRMYQFWEARKAGDLLTLYELEAVSVNNQISLRQYINNSGDLVYKNFRIIEINSEDANSAYALIEVEVLIPGLSKSIKSQFEDKWVKLEGRWYHSGRAYLPLTQ